MNTTLWKPSMLKANKPNPACSVRWQSARRSGAPSGCLVRAGLLILASVAFPALAGTITIKSSASLDGLTHQWAEAYQRAHPGTKIEITSGEIPSAFDALKERKADVVTAPRAIKFKEAQACEAALGKRPADFKVGVNGLAVYVNADNPIKILTYAELENIFNGKYRNWNEVGGNDAPIVVLSQATNSAAGELFKAEVLNDKDFAPGAKCLLDSEITPAVAKTKTAIGFGKLGPADGARALEIKRAQSSTPAEPTEETISNRTYPISRYLYHYINAASDNAEIKAYLDWVRSDDGQQVVKASGFYSLPAKLRSTH